MLMRPASIAFVLSSMLSQLAGAESSIPLDRQQALRNLLVQDCGSCHGLQMKGGLGPALLRSNLHGKSVEFITTTILDGRPGTAMPGWRPLVSEFEARWMSRLLLEQSW